MSDQQRFDFERAVDALLESKESLLRACRESRPNRGIGDRTDLVEEIAWACKRALNSSGLSREELLDKINELLDMGQDAESGAKSLSMHMLNHYLSKSVEYPIPAYLVTAIAHVTGSLEPLQVLVESLGARVITAEDEKLMHLGKVDALHTELLRVKRELRRT